MSQLQRANSLEGQSQESQEVTAISHPWELHTHHFSSLSLMESDQRPKLTSA